MARRKKEPPVVVPHYALVEGGDPFAVKHSYRAANDYQGWAPEQLESIYEQWKRLRHWDHAHSDGDGEKNEVERGHWRDDAKTETVLNADEGFVSTTARPTQDGKHPYDPRSYPPSKTVNNPAMYTFLRETYRAPELSGYKTTMADHIRVHIVGVMRPVYRKDMRNTYRLSPDPWDEDLVDRPGELRDQPLPAAAIQYPTGGRGSFRLGG